MMLLVTAVVQAQRTFRVVSYNVENLFDLHHDTLKNDYDFLPEGNYHWTPRRYWDKLTNIAQVIVGAGNEEGVPVLVGLCEVENDTVLHDLTCRSLLRSIAYDYVMTDSPDRRGVDVALLYQPYLFRLLEWRNVRVPSVEHGFPPTRDQLYAKGVLVSGDTVHVVVCHLPSKAGGGRGATRHRELAVGVLRQVVDSVLTAQPQARLLVMGDFNATVGEKIFRRLIPPLYETLPTDRRSRRQPCGTYYYKEQWSYLDHIFVSDGWRRWQAHQMRLADGEGDESNACRSAELRLPFLLNDKGVPNRTYRGPSYNGGVSDHLPLCMDFRVGYSR